MMTTVLVLESQPGRQIGLGSALATAGYTPRFVASAAEAQQVLQKGRIEIFFICDVLLADGATQQLAVEAEGRGVRTVVVARDQPTLEALRAKGLICFAAPDALQDLQSAVCARL